jgi:hypothetical protein
MSDTKIGRNARLWKRDLSGYPGAGVTLPNLRGLTMDDVPALGALFFGAFLGTIDDVGQTEAQYEEKAKAILGGRYGEWIATASWAIEDARTLRAACLVCDYTPYGCPAIAIVATSPSRKRSGDAGALVNAVLSSHGSLRYGECCAMVTIGNEASEQLFKGRGFLPQNV